MSDAISAVRRPQGLDHLGSCVHTVHMKRTNLVLDEQTLDEAKALTGSRTYSETVNLALRDLVRRRRFAEIDRFAGSDVWDGDLKVMRDDRVPR